MALATNSDDYFIRCPEKECQGLLVDVGATPRHKEELMCDWCGKHFDKSLFAKGDGKCPTDAPDASGK